MLNDLAASEGGLKLHSGKTEAICDHPARLADPREKLQLGSDEVKVLPEGAATKYLGRTLRLDLHDDAEIEGRINSAWKRFMGFCEEFATVPSL